MPLFEETILAQVRGFKADLDKIESARVGIDQFEQFCQVLKAHGLPIVPSVYLEEPSVRFHILLPASHAAFAPELLTTLGEMDCGRRRTWGSGGVELYELTHHDVPDFALTILRPDATQPEPAHAAAEV